jgi:excisionase family DNA binding protein
VTGPPDPPASEAASDAGAAGQGRDHRASPAELAEDGRLILSARGAAILAAALRVSVRAAARNGVDFRARSGAAEFVALLGMAEACAAVAVPGHEPDSPRPGVAGSGPVVTTVQAAAGLGVSPRTVRRWCAAGALRARRAGHAWLVEDTGDWGRACR